MSNEKLKKYLNDMNYVRKNIINSKFKSYDIKFIEKNEKMEADLIVLVFYRLFK